MYFSFNWELNLVLPFAVIKNTPNKFVFPQDSELSLRIFKKEILWLGINLFTILAKEQLKEEYF